MLKTKLSVDCHSRSDLVTAESSQTVRFATKDPLLYCSGENKELAVAANRSAFAAPSKGGVRRAGSRTSETDLLQKEAAQESDRAFARRGLNVPTTETELDFGPFLERRGAKQASAARRRVSV